MLIKFIWRENIGFLLTFLFKVSSFSQSIKVNIYTFLQQDKTDTFLSTVWTRSKEPVFVDIHTYNLIAFRL